MWGQVLHRLLSQGPPFTPVPVAQRHPCFARQAGIMAADPDGPEDNEQETVQDEKDKQRAEQRKAMGKMTDLVSFCRALVLGCSAACAAA